MRGAPNVLAASLVSLCGCDELEPGLFPGFDEPPPDAADLTDYRRPVLIEQNGFAWLDLKGEDVHWPDDDENVQGKSPSFDAAAAKEVISRNQAVLERLDAGLRAPELQVPEIRSSDDLVGYLLAWRSIAYIVSCRARLLEEAGDATGALGEAFQLIKFGHAIEGSQGASVHYLVGLAIKCIGLEHVRRLAGRPDLPVVTWKYCAAELRGFETRRLGLQDALRVEYLALSQEIEKLCGGKESSTPAPSLLHRLAECPPLLKPRQTQRWLADDLRLLIRNAGVRACDRDDLEAERRYGRKKRWDWLLANGTGKRMLHGLLPTFEQTIRQADLGDWSVASTRALLALKCFQTVQGRLPEQLDELVPNHLDAVPLDPFDGKPLRYVRGKGIVYAVGRDLKDRGGSTLEDASARLFDADEPTLGIAF